MTGRWRYRSRFVTLIIALLVVDACGGDPVAEESPAALALQASDEGLLRSEPVEVPDDAESPDQGVKPASEPAEPSDPFDPSHNNASGLFSADMRYPLSVLVAPNDEALSRPVLMVKIDNHPRARPQVGLDQADIVFDVRAEGVTRFAAVFQSTVPDPVGPVRSSRTSDFDLLVGFDRPLYASSGGNANVAAGFRRLPIVELTNLTRSEYFRQSGRPAPHNLFVNASDLYRLAPDDIADPQPWFAYGSPDRQLPSSAEPVAGAVTIDFRGSPVVTHTWDDDRRGWLRTQDGSPHETADGVQLAPENVVVAVTDYSPSPADLRSPEVRSTGSGDLLVLTAGHAIVGTWHREDATEPLSLVDASGDEILLSAGRTWILMPEQGQIKFSAGEMPESWPGDDTDGDTNGDTDGGTAQGVAEN